MIGFFDSSSNFSLAAIQALKIDADTIYLSEPIPPEENPYLEVVNIPDYDSGESTHFLIPDDGDFIQANLDNVNYRHFYVRPGDYQAADNSSETIITRSGTESNPRTISLYNGNDLHPAQMTVSENAQIATRFDDADWWVIDRMSNFGYFDYANRFRNSEHCIVNRFYSTLNGYSMLIDNGSHYFTLQKSRFDGAVPGDAVGANNAPWGNDYFDAAGNKHSSILHTKIIQNEFVDQNDGWQATVWAVEYDVLFQFCNVGGLIVNDNDFYLNPGFTDKENATDTKCGSPDPKPDAAHDNSIDNPTITCEISGNRAWGYNGGADQTGNSAIIASMYSPGYLIKDNIIFESNNGSTGGSNSPQTDMYYGYHNATITNNIYYRCGNDSATQDRWKAPMTYNNGYNVQMDENYIIEPQSNWVARFGDQRGGSTFSNNKVLDPFNNSWDVELRTDAPNDASFITTVATTAEVSRIGYTDYSFYKDKFTNNPTLITLPNILDPNGTIVSPE